MNIFTSMVKKFLVVLMSVSLSTATMASGLGAESDDGKPKQTVKSTSTDTQNNNQPIDVMDSRSVVKGVANGITTLVGKCITSPLWMLGAGLVMVGGAVTWGVYYVCSKAKSAVKSVFSKENSGNKKKPE